MCGGNKSSPAPAPPPIAPPAPIAPNVISANESWNFPGSGGLEDPQKPGTPLPASTPTTSTSTGLSIPKT